MHLNDTNPTELRVTEAASKEGYKLNFTAETDTRPTTSFSVMLGGEGILSTEDGEIRVGAGDIFFLKRNCRYRSEWIASAADPLSFLSLHFSFPDPMNRFQRRIYPSQKFRPENFGEITEAFRGLQTMLLRGEPNIFATLSVFYRILSETVPRLTVSDGEGRCEKLRPALEYLRAHLNESVSVRDLAGECFLSEPRFYALFRKTYGVSPIAYRNRLRMEAAARYLLAFPERSVEEISAELNFSSSVYFIRLFREQFGQTPFRYRKENSPPGM